MILNVISRRDVKHYYPDPTSGKATACSQVLNEIYAIGALFKHGEISIQNLSTYLGCLEFPVYKFIKIRFNSYHSNLLEAKCYENLVKQFGNGFFSVHHTKSDLPPSP